MDIKIRIGTIAFVVSHTFDDNIQQHKLEWVEHGQYRCVIYNRDVEVAVQVMGEVLRGRFNLPTAMMIS